jgi:hypothetical protein
MRIGEADVNFRRHALKCRLALLLTISMGVTEFSFGAVQGHCISTVA